MGQKILRRWHSIRLGVGRERRQVMWLLTGAAARVAPASVEQLVGLAGALMAVLQEADGLLLRWYTWWWRIRQLLEKVQEERYGNMPGLLGLLAASLGYSPEESCGRRRRGPRKRRPSRPRAGEESQPEISSPEFESSGGCASFSNQQPQCFPEQETLRAPGQAHEAPAQTPASAAPPRRALRVKLEGPDLPRRFEDFQALVDRAFCAPGPAPAKGELRRRLDQVAHALWQRLHLFDQMRAKEKRELGQELEAMGEGVPEYADDVEERRERIGRVLDAEATEEQAKKLYLECQRRLGQLLNLRFGFGPASRFLQSTEWDDPDCGEWDDDADWAEAG